MYSSLQSSTDKNVRAGGSMRSEPVNSDITDTVEHHLPEVKMRRVIHWITYEALDQEHLVMTPRLRQLNELGQERPFQRNEKTARHVTQQKKDCVQLQNTPANNNALEYFRDEWHIKIRW